VFRANYNEMSGQPPTMDVFLAVGVDPTEAQAIGCGVVRRELTQARLPNVRWIVRAANGEPAADSASTRCP
jgi:hypothetical protein